MQLERLSLQDDDVRYRIRTLYLDGKNIKQIQAELNIVPETWYANYYRDTNGFRVFIDDLQLQAMKHKARQNLQDIANMDISELNDPRYLKIKADISQFIAETIDKDVFSKKKEDESDKTSPITVNIVSNKPQQTLPNNENMALQSRLYTEPVANVDCATSLEAEKQAE